MVNLKELCKNCPVICSCLGGRKKDKETYSETITNESKVSLPKEEITEARIEDDNNISDIENNSETKNKNSEGVRIISTNDHVEGYDNMDHLYLSIPIGCEQLAGIRLIVESHDQGWGGADGSSWSWGEVGILDSEGKEKGSRIEMYRNNVADREWQIHEKVITENGFLSGIKKGDKVAIWLRSQYLGWKNYAKSGKIELFENMKGSVIEKLLGKDCHSNEAKPESKASAKGNAQEWLDQNYPKEIRSSITDLNISNKKLEGELDLGDFTNLERLDARNNHLTNLQLFGCSNLIHLDVSNNPQLKKSLDIFRGLKNLEVLCISGTSLSGSLEPLKDCSKLKYLDINNLDIDRGLEFLSESLEKLRLNDNPPLGIRKKNKLEEELFLYGYNIKALKEAGGTMINSYENSDLEIVTNVLNELDGRLLLGVQPRHSKEKIRETYELGETGFQEIILRDKRPFSWENKRNKSLLAADLPLKLYNIKENKVEWTKNNPNVKNYAILSYVWGDLSDKSLLTTWDYTYQKENGELEPKHLGVSPKDNATGTTKWSIKALTKAIRTCQLFSIDHLWMDQLCIDQFNVNEVNQEVPKAKRYYNNAEVTLISMNTEVDSGDTDKESHEKFATEILKKITNSEWFSRAWTFQEGLLSKQTLLMFDDYLVDGRILAQAWVSPHKKREYWYYQKEKSFLNRSPEIFATPVGWNYCGNNFGLDSQVNLGLSRALEAVKNRGRSIPIDGIYSILGLLPYGDKVVPRYKKWGEKHTKEEMDEVLFDIFKLAIREGYKNETLSWHGPRRNEPNKWLIPSIDEKGGVVEIKGIIDIDPLGNLEFSADGISLVGSVCVISDKITGADSVVWGLGINVETADGFEFDLYGSMETLGKVKSGDLLIVPKQKWKRDEHTVAGFAILVPDKTNIDCSIDVLKLTYLNYYWEKKIDYSELCEARKVFIDMIKKEVVDEKEENVAQIQISPKN